MSPTRRKGRVTIDLETFHEDGLEQLAGLLPHESKEELLKIVISRGLVEMLRSEFERHRPSAKEVSQNMMAARERMQELSSNNVVAASKLRSSAQRMARGTGSPAPFGLKHSLDELHVMEAEHDEEMARMRKDLGLAETREGTPDRQVENYIGVPLSEGLRQGLASMVSAYPDLEEESLYAALLELGIKSVRDDPKVLAPTRSLRDARSVLETKEAARQRHRAEWRLLCRSVASGWR